MDTTRSFWQHKNDGREPKFGARARSTLAATPLQSLQRRYRAALSGAVVAKARYLAQSGEAFATAISIERARWRWQRIEGCRARLALEISRLKQAAEPFHHPEQRELRV